jgi:hypothetical protein
MRLSYDRSTIDQARTEGEGLGHPFKGRFTHIRNSLSWEHHCTGCRAYLLVFPQWAPWHPRTFTGPAVNDFCPKGA